MTRWDGLADAPRGAAYARHWDRLAATGADVHGEAAFVDSLLAPGSSVLDAGCGTGRVAIRLAELGHVCTGVDADPTMLEHARRSGPDVTWALADLAGNEVPAGPFDLVVAAGNVMILLTPGTEAGVVAALAARTGVLVAGFGLAAPHLPVPEAPFDLDTYDAWCAAAGLQLTERWSTWARDPWDRGSGYAVSVHVTAGEGLAGEREPLH
ncbi:class I SAM-dependent DNA methyltransferase [Jatrophihabitans sp. YIM 134969]